MLNTIQQRREMLQIKNDFLNNNVNCFKGNTNERTQYLNLLNDKLPNLLPYQTQMIVGLGLSDASFQAGSNGTMRLKMQMNVTKKGFVQHVQENISEYCAKNTLTPVTRSNSNMVELDTFKCIQIAKVAEIFKDPSTPALKTNENLKKTIQPALEQFITPVSIAYWLCGDGGTSPGSSGTGKQIDLHSQSFTETENILLAQMLKNKFDFSAEAKTHVRRGKTYYYIAISGKSYEDFVRLVGPWVHPDFHSRIPKGRSLDTRSTHPFPLFETERNRIIGSKLLVTDDLYNE